MKLRRVFLLVGLFLTAESGVRGQQAPGTATPDPAVPPTPALTPDPNALPPTQPVAVAGQTDPAAVPVSPASAVAPVATATPAAPMVPGTTAPPQQLLICNAQSCDRVACNVFAEPDALGETVYAFVCKIIPVGAGLPQVPASGVTSGDGKPIRWVPAFGVTSPMVAGLTAPSGPCNLNHSHTSACRK